MQGSLASTLLCSLCSLCWEMPRMLPTGRRAVVQAMALGAIWTPNAGSQRQFVPSSDELLRYLDAVSDSAFWRRADDDLPAD